MAIDEARLEEFINQFAGDFGAALHASTVVDRRQARPVPGAGRARARRRRGARRGDRLRSPAGAGVARRPVRRRLLPLQHRRPSMLLAEPRAGGRARRPGQPGVPRRRHDDRRVDRQGRGEDPRGVPIRRGPGLARAPPRPVPRHRAAVQAGLRRPTSSRSGSRRSTASHEKLGAGGSIADLGCGHGASTILLAAGLPERDRHRVRLPPGVDRHRPQARRGGRRRRSRPVRGRLGAGLPGRPATTWCASSTRCTTWATRSARPATSGRRSRRTARGCSSSRWPARASRTTSTRSAGSSTRPPRSSARPAAQAQPGGYALGAQVPEADARRARRRCRLQPLPPGHRDAVQPRLRSPTLSRPRKPTDNEPRRRPMTGVEINDFSSPDEVRRPERTTVEVVKIGGGEIGRYTFQPGWRWSEYIKPVVGTESCQIEHVGYVVSGTMHVEQRRRNQRRRDGRIRLPHRARPRRAGSSATNPSSSSSSRVPRPTPSTDGQRQEQLSRSDRR